MHNLVLSVQKLTATMMVLNDLPISYPVIKEEEQIHQAQQRPEAFRPLYELYHKPILQYVYNRTDNLEVAADITSTIFLKALSNIKRYQQRQVPFAAWLYKIAFNEVLQYHRHTKRQRKVYIAASFLQELAGETSQHLDHLKVQLQRALKELKNDEIDLLELRYWEEKPIKEIAYILSLSESNVKVRLHRLHHKLKKAITKKVQS